MDDFEYPQPNQEELPDLYDTLDKLASEAESALYEHFDVQTRDGVEVVVFANADIDQILDALWHDSEVLVNLFQKTTGLPDREFERLYGESNIGGLAGRKRDFRDEEQAVKFATAIDEHIPDEIALHTLIYTYIKMWEGDQRRHFRADFEEDVREVIEDAGYDVFKGNSLPEEPDFVVPTSEPYQVLGEVRVVQPRDYKKRFKEFGSEARAAADNFPEAKFVAVPHLPPHDLETRREELREKVHKWSNAEIHRVYFQDELDDLLDQFEDWGIGRQSSLSE